MIRSNVRKDSAPPASVPRLLIAAVLCTAGALLMLPAFASANTTISYSSTQNKLLVSTDGGESNYITVSQQGNTYSFAEDGFNDTTFNSIDLTETATQCTRLTTPSVHVDCTIAGLSFIDVNLGTGDFDGFDASDLASAIPNPVSTNIVVDGGNGDDYVLGGTGNDTLTGGTGDDDLEGDAGNDTIDSGDDADSYVDGGTGNDTIGGGQGDDFLVGGEGNDRLTGGNGDDSYEGDDGDDSFISESTADGADSIDDFGDIGTDTADYSARTAAVELSNDDDFNDGSLAQSAEDGIGGRDEIASDIEIMFGGKAADTLRGVGAINSTPNVLRGNAGNDKLIGTDGIEPDTADYSNAPGAVTVDLAAGTATGGADIDTLTAIEDAYGSPGADTLTGDGSANLLRGNLGTDTLAGGGGTDTADYANSASAVTMNLAAPNPHATGAAGSDTLTSMESVSGGSGNDTLTGDAGVNTLTGNDGSDTLTGGAGVDAFSGGAGGDSLITRQTPADADTPIDCGDGDDIVTADPLPNDDPTAGCELVNHGSGALPPSPPTLTAVSPAGPANANSPVITGSAAGGTTVNLYDNGLCSGTPVSTGTASASFASPGITASVANDSTTDFSARAVDGSSQLSGCSNSLTYVEDSTAPGTAITLGPTDSTNDTTPTFEFSSTEPNSTFQCRVDGGAFASCSSPSTTAALADGPHTFEVKAKDTAGNEDTTPASQAFTVKQDVVPPAGGANGGGGGGSPPVSDSTAPKMALASKSAKASKKGAVKLKITCPASEQGGCAGSVSLGKIQSGSASFGRVGAGKDATVTIKLSSKARKTLKKKKKLAATVTITARDDTGNSTTISAKLTIKK